MRKAWIVFSYKGKELLRITRKDIIPGEINETRKLLSWERGIVESEIEVKEVFE